MAGWPVFGSWFVVVMDAALLVGALVASVVLLVVSAFFSSSEIAIFSLSKEKAEEMAGKGDRGSRVLGELREDPHRLLVTLLVGNNVMNIMLGSIVTVVLATVLPAGWAVLGATLVSSLLVLVFGEIVPKSWGLGNAERWARVVAVPLRVAEYALYPLVAPLDWVTGFVNEAIRGDPEIEKPLVRP